MADIWRNPLGASSLPPRTLFVPSRILFFSKPSLHTTNGVRNSNFAPKMRSPNRRILSSKSDSDSTSSSSDFDLLSTSECSDGSIIFRFGHARESETTAASVDVEKTDDAATDGLMIEHDKQSTESMVLDTSSEQVKSHSKRRGRRKSTQVRREVGRVLDRDNNEQLNNESAEPDSGVHQVTSRTKKQGRRSSAKQSEGVSSVVDKDCSEVESVNDSISEFSESVERSTVDTKTNDPSCPKSSVDEVSEVDVVRKVEIHSNIEENTASTGENGVIDVADNHASQASSEESSNPEVASLTKSDEDNDNLVELTNVSTRTQDETLLDQGIHTSASDDDVEAEQTKTAIALGYNVSSTISEDERANETNRSNVAGVSTSEVVEVHSIKETPMREETSAAGLVLSSGVASLPHPLKGGEDAYFIAFQSWLGVADGVGQWSLEGSSVALYARELMDNCERIVAECKGVPLKTPEEVLIESVAETRSPGSSTILVAYFDGQTFHVANIGDSGFIIIRNGAVFGQSSPMVHEFNFPVHIERGHDPSKLIQVYKIDLDEGDVIVTATDGLFDNLYEQEISSIVSKSLEAGFKPQDTAKFLAKRAQEVGRSSSSGTPFADTAQAVGYVGYVGGKLDDVVVIVSLLGYNVSSTSSEEERASKTNTSNVAGVSTSEVVEVHSIKVTRSREETSTAGFVLSSGVASLPHPSKGGEDAYFMACQSWLGVADVVTGSSLHALAIWELLVSIGSNAALYARELMDNCERIVADRKGIPVYEPEKVLVRSVAETQSPGSSTILVAYFDGKTFHVANIGDSGFIIIRNGAVYQKSSPMVHEFNFPVHIERGDDPSKLIEGYKIDLDEGDVIVTATDGLLDNLYEQEIASIVSKSYEAGFKPQDTAKFLANIAQEVGRLSSSGSPFADAAQAAGYVSYAGGKLDDVVVIVSLVQKKSIC